MAIGGSISSIALDGREFPVAADADISVKLGGFENEVQANGNSTARTVKTRVPWSLAGVVVENDNDRADQEYIQGLANRNTNFPVAITYVDGNTRQAQGQFVDEIVSSTQGATTAISLSGPGELTLQ